MMNRRFYTALCAAVFFLFCSSFSSAQDEKEHPVQTDVPAADQSEQIDISDWKSASLYDFSAIDAYVKSCGTMTNSTPAAVARKVTSVCKNDYEKARALFDWISYNIAYDTSYSVYTMEKAFRLRKSVCAGYSALFQTMADAVGLRCREVSGSAKNSESYSPGGHLGGHAWNIVTLEGREMLLDSTWGAGYVNGTTFTRRFAPCWFDTHPADYIFTHYPSYRYDQLLEPTISADEFVSLPYFGPELTWGGLKEAQALPFFMANPGYNSVCLYAGFASWVSSGMRIYDMPIERQLHIGKTYSITMDETHPYTVSASCEIKIENGKKTFTFTPVKRGTIDIIEKRQSSTRHFARYVCVEKTPSFSARNPSPGMSFSIYQTKPVPAQIFVEVKTGPDTADALYIANTELTHEQLKKMGGKRSFSYDSEYEPAVGLTLWKITDYCIYLSKQDGLRPYYIKEDDTILYDKNADGYRLPTRAELEYITGAAFDTARTPSGSDVRGSAWFAENSGMQPWIVGQRAQDSFGLYDLLGNAAEICFDEETQTVGLFGGSSKSARSEILSPGFVPLPKTSADTAIPDGAVRLVRRLPRTPEEECQTAMLIYQGKGYEKNFQKAFRLFLSSAEKGYSPAMNMAGEMLLLGEGTEKDIQKGSAFLLSSAQKGSSYGCWRTAQLYEQSVLTSPDGEDTALAYYIRAADAGYEDAQLLAAKWYREGMRVEKNDEKSFGYAKAAAESGTAAAFFQLAKYYIEGIGTDKNEETGYTLYKKAADKGSDEARAALGDCQYYGIGTKANHWSAFSTYSKLSKKGNLHARYMTAKMTYLGEGIKRSLDDARGLFDGLEYEVADGITSSEYIERIDGLKKFLKTFGKTAQTFFNAVPDGKDPYEVMCVYAELNDAAVLLSGKPLANPFLFRGMSADDIYKKVIVPMTALSCPASSAAPAQTSAPSSPAEDKAADSVPLGAETALTNPPPEPSEAGETAAVSPEPDELGTEPAADTPSTASSRTDSKRLVIILPAGTSSHSLVSSVYGCDFFTSRGLFMNGERYRCDQSFADYYDEFIVCSSAGAKNVFAKLTAAPCARTDIMCIGTVLCSGGTWIADKNTLASLWLGQIDSGIKPRLICLGNSTDTIQISVNTLLGKDFAPSVNVFGTPLAMTGEIAAGFRGGTLCLFMLAKPFTAAAAARIYMYETAPKKNSSAPNLPASFVVSAEQLTRLRALPLTKGGTVIKPGSMIMEYTIVKPAK